MGGTSWRRAFCTSLPRNSSDSPFADKQTQTQSQTHNQNSNPSPSPRSRIKFGFLSSSNPSTPRFQSPSPTLRCRTAPPPSEDNNCSNISEIKTPVSFHSSNPGSPKSPSRFSLFKTKTSLRLSKNSCGICLQNVKTGQGTAIFTAECSHAFHFPCIAGHVNKFGSLVCPVCKVNWREVPLLAIHKQSSKPEPKAKVELQQQYTNHKKSSSPRDLKHNQSISKPSVYDDDEPLLSPRFNPIPEADEDGDDEEEEEFQGFFVNPNLDYSHSNVIHHPRDTRRVDIKLLPQAAMISVGRTHETYAVVLKVKAPAPSSAAQNSKTAKLLDPGRRAPIDLVTVLDVSGTMTGAKLQMLKRAMRLVVSSLGSADRLSIIAFNSSSPKRLLALRRMTCQGQRSARKIIDRLVCTQAEAAGGVGEALRKATKVLEDRRERNPVASVMLLSDGQGQEDDGGTHRRKAYAGVSNVSKSSTRFAHLEIPVTHEPAEDAFAKCVGGLLSVVVQDLRLKLGFCSGSTPVEIVGVYSCNGRPTSLGSGSGLVRLGDLYAEEERELLVELRVPIGSTGPVGLVDAAGVHHVMAIKCSYKDPSSLEAINGREESLLVPRPRDVRSADPKIERLRNLFVANRAIAEARRCIEHNELSTAHRMLTSARALIKQCSSNAVDEYIDGLDLELKELNHRRHYQRQQTFPSQVMMQRQRTNERESPTTATTTAYLDDNGEPLTPTSAWRAAEKLAKVAIMRKSMNKVGDLHGFENARF